MRNDPIYSTLEAARMLHVSKSTIYELLKRGELNSSRVGRNIRFSQNDIDEYLQDARIRQQDYSRPARSIEKTLSTADPAPGKGIVLSGQDVILDVLSNHMWSYGVHALRAYVGSFESLLSLYNDQVKIASAHLWDYENDIYNIPFVKHLLPGVPAVVIHLTCRYQGLYVQSGNPKDLHTWEDLGSPGITLINREKGSGSRVLLDGKLRLAGIDGYTIDGYTHETSSHLTVASTVAAGDADVGVGTEKIARQIEGIEFIPLQKESYDLVVKKRDWDSHEIQTLVEIIRSDRFRKEFASIGGYDIQGCGDIIAET